MLRQAVYWSFLLLAVGVPALGQIEVGKITTDNIQLLDYSRPIWEYATGGLFILIVLAIGFKASRRSHAS